MFASGGGRVMVPRGSGSGGMGAVAVGLTFAPVTVEGLGADGLGVGLEDGFAPEEAFGGVPRLGNGGGEGLTVTVEPGAAGLETGGLGRTVGG